MNISVVKKDTYSGAEQEGRDMAAVMNRFGDREAHIGKLTGQSTKLFAYMMDLRSLESSPH
jgi:nicotinic acid phosphoribosyltransferase